MESHGGNGVCMTKGFMNRLSRGRIPQPSFGTAITIFHGVGPGQEQLPIGTDRHGQDSGRMRQRRSEWLAGRDIPQLCRLVKAPRQDPFAVRAEGYSRYPTPMLQWWSDPL